MSDRQIFSAFFRLGLCHQLQRMFHLRQEGRKRFFIKAFFDHGTGLRGRLIDLAQHCLVIVRAIQLIHLIEES